MRKIGFTAAAVLAATLGFAGAAGAAEVRLMTGPQAGFWVPLGGQLKDAWEKAVPDLKIQALPGAGIANIRGIQEGKAEVGFGNTITTADAVAGTGEAPLDKAHDKVCNVATLYPQYFQLVVNADAGINSLKDLKGKGFATQVKGNTGELIARHVLKVSGYTYSDVKASFTNSYTDSVEQMKDNRMHAFALGTGIPASSLMDLASSRDIKLIDMTDIYEPMRKINPAYKLVTIPKGTYPKQDKDVQVIGYYTHVVAGLLAAGGYRSQDDGGHPAQEGPDGCNLQGARQVDAADHGPGHRRAVPPRRRQVVQGARHHGEVVGTVADQARRPGAAATPPQLQGRHKGQGSTPNDCHQRNHAAVAAEAYGSGRPGDGALPHLRHHSAAGFHLAVAARGVSRPADRLHLPRHPSHVRDGADVSLVPPEITDGRAAGSADAGAAGRAREENRRAKPFRLAADRGKHRVDRLHLRLLRLHHRPDHLRR